MARLALTMLVFLGAVVAAPVAVAKEGIRARLVSPIPRDVPGAAKLEVAWTLRTVDGGPVGASGFFVRVTGRPGTEPREADAIEAGGRYVASAVVPPGGIQKVQIGLRGWRQMRGGPWEPADVFFDIEGPIFREPADAPPVRRPWLLLTIPAGGSVWWLRLRQRRAPGSWAGRAA
jgi:hypothetical protein